MKDCVFCKIVNKEIPAHIVYEDDDSLAFLDINPVNPGHVLVIPKAHYTNILETPDELVGYLFKVAKKIMLAIKKSMSADYVVVSVVGVDVPHFHIHLIPRGLKDGLANFWPTKKYTENDATNVAKKIIEALN